MGFPLLVRRHLYIESGPRQPCLLHGYPYARKKPFISKHVPHVGGTCESWSLALTLVTRLLVPRSSRTVALYWPSLVNTGACALRTTVTRMLAFRLAIQGLGTPRSNAETAIWNEVVRSGQLQGKYIAQLHASSQRELQESFLDGPSRRPKTRLPMVIVWVDFVTFNCEQCRPFMFCVPWYWFPKHNISINLDTVVCTHRFNGCVIFKC